MGQIFNIDQAREAGILRDSSCAFGVFDGVHAGHRFLIGQACKDAESTGGASVVLTFDVDPDELFRADGLKKLLTNEDRIQMLSDTGVDAVVVLEFTKDFSNLLPADFLQLIFKDDTPSSLHVGSDFRFGRRASGDVSVLKEWGSHSGMRIFGYDLVSIEGQSVSSTRIRTLLSEGDVESAASLLTYPYTLHDTVKAGRGEGRDMGFRTANLIVDESRRILREGVYGAYAFVDGVRYKAAVSVGVSPTFKGRTEAYSEVHILDFHGDIYDQDIYVQFVSWIRPMIEFESIDELISTVMANISWVRDNL